MRPGLIHNSRKGLVAQVFNLCIYIWEDFPKVSF
jgi:hypothetical protein